MNQDYSTKRILLIDDTAFLRAGLIKILIELGFNKLNIFEAEDGKKAGDLLKASQNNPADQFHLILSDWNMPNVSGLELLKQVRASTAYYKTVPFVLITTVSEKDKIIEALSFSLSGYLIKPLVKDKLQATLSSIFKN